MSTSNLVDLLSRLMDSKDDPVSCQIHDGYFG